MPPVRALALATTFVAFSIALGACGGGDGDGRDDDAAATSNASADFELTSPVLADGGTIPTRYTCDGDGLGLPIGWSAPPPGTAELALVVFDPDAPGAGFVHELVHGIPPQASPPAPGGHGGVDGMNSLGQEQWVPPCPPPGDEPHHYELTLYALSDAPEVAPSANLDQFVAAIEGTVVARARLTGRYGR